MKTLTLILTGIIALPSFAQVANGLHQLDVKKVLEAGASAAPERTQNPPGRPLNYTNMQAIYNSGSGNAVEAQFDLDEGHYILGRNETSDEDLNLFINRMANDSSRYIGILIDNETIKSRQGSAQILIGAPTNTGSEIQFSPAFIDMLGNLVDSSEGSTRAKVLRISLKPDFQKTRPRHPYLVRGLNNSTNGILLGMRGAESSLNLKKRPDRNIFTWKAGGSSIVVNGKIVTISTEGVSTDVYQMSNLNGASQVFSNLVMGDENTMTTDLSTDVKAVALSVFMNDPESGDSMLILSPRVNNILFNVKIYQPNTENGFFHKLFGKQGSLTPKNSKSKFLNWDDN